MKKVKLIIEFEPSAGIADIQEVLDSINDTIIKNDKKWCISKYTSEIMEED